LAAADRVAAEIEGLSSNPPTAQAAFTVALSSLYVTLGQFTRAEAFASRLAAGPRGLQYLKIAMQRRDAGQVRAVLAREFPKLEDTAGVISALIESEQIDKARAARDLFAKRPGPSRPYLAFVDGQLALLDGRLDEAVQQIDTFLKFQEPGFGYAVAEKLAEALAAKGELDKGITLLESFSRDRSSLVTLAPGATRGMWDWLPLRDRLAILYRQAGRHRDADAIESELSALLEVADDDHPIKRRLTAR
jgi:hypothetical protein